ncbi:ketopantoate reductase family protein [Pseudolysinimonas sp.]|uniref:ketopantoate reductase family protein n=1 Tax=Pseudolysinimonas sp. TaxID=2680009 RepID=UPI003F7EE779
MRIAVLGTGAQGAGIGADLLRAGLDVTFIEQWPAHVEAMRRDGIEVRMPQETQVTPVPRALHLCDVATLREPFDLVITLVKAYDTRWAVQLIEPYLAPDGLVAGLQNGMSLDVIADVVGPDRALGAVIEMASNMYEPGIVNRQNPPSQAWFALGGMSAVSQAGAERAAEVLRHAGTVEVTDDIRSAKWMKLVVNAGELVPSAILDLALPDAVRVPGMHEFMLEACREAVHTAVATGNRMVPIFGLEDMDLSDPDRFVEQLLDAVLNVFSLSDTRTTVLQDWDKGRHSEVDEINGLVVAEQRRIGGCAPVNELTVELAHRIEAGELEARPENVDLMVGAVVR